MKNRRYAYQYLAPLYYCHLYNLSSILEPGVNERVRFRFSYEHSVLQDEEHYGNKDR